MADHIPPGPGGHRRPLTEPWVVALAGATAVGAWWTGPVPLVAALALAAIAAAARRPALTCLAVGLLAAALGARSVRGLTPATPAPFHGLVTLVADPSDAPFGVRVDVRAGGRRYELHAHGGAGGALQRSLAGERVRVTGRVRAPPPNAPWLVPRHVVGSIDASEVERHDGGGGLWRAANRVRRLLDRGAEGLPPRTRPLFLGFVIGDDRGQPPDVTDDFRAAGLTHLLVVSGENVAFMLVLLGPVLGRLPLGARWVATIGAIGGFTVLTRCEPSVLRAVAMAAIASTATLLGRQASGLRVLSLAVTGLLLIDPLLVRSVGFQLSVGASAGIVLLARPIARRLPGPRSLAAAVAVTVAAQAGVAPVQIPRFGGVPVASLVANPLAVPIAGLVTTWGLGAGLLAGLVGSPVRWLLHVPTRLMIEWVALIARLAARLPLGQLGWIGFGAAAVGLLLVSGRPGRHRAAVRVVGGLVLVASLVAPGVRLARSPAPRVTVDRGVELWRAGGATVVELNAPVSSARLLADLRQAGVRRVDVLVRLARSRPADDPVGPLRHRWPIGRVVDVRGPPVRLRIGDLVVDTGGPPRSHRVALARPEG